MYNVDMENEIELTDKMKRATPADIFRIYRQFWGDRIPYYIKHYMYTLESPDICITCANCGEYHSIYISCK